jgi:hypothetical protein
VLVGAVGHGRRVISGDERARQWRAGRTDML